VSQASASLFLVVVLLVLAGYLVFVPPPGFEDNVAHHIALPLLMVAVAFGVLENLRTRTHIGQLIGAIRSLMGKRGVEPTPEIKGEAIEILLRSLRNGDDSVRRTAAAQLKNLTGQDFGEDPEAWAGWWTKNKGEYGK
jgi:hypothetical protein